LLALGQENNVSRSPNLHHTTTWLWLALIGAGAGGCAGPTEELEPAAGPPAARQTPVDPTPGERLYIAELRPLNGQLTERGVTGRATFIINDQEGTIDATVLAHQLEPRAEYSQYLHGSPQGEETSCPTVSADRNGDDIVDAAELAPYAGVPLFALNTANMSLDAADFPIADEDGRLRYREIAPLVNLHQTMHGKPGAIPLRVERFVVILYGAPLGADIPESVASPHGQPPAKNVPIACGEITQVS
jgi:hypothetical protein